MAGGEADHSKVVASLRMNGAIPPIPYMTSWRAQVVYFNVTFSTREERVVLACDSDRWAM
jgi:hypothetical protein